MTDPNPSPSEPLLHGPSVRPLSRRILEVGALGALLAAWLGIGEALLLFLTRSIAEKGYFLRETTLAYAALGLVGGLAWGALCESTIGRAPLWNRKKFYCLSLVLLVLLFQITVQTQVRWVPKQMIAGGLGSLAITFTEAVPVLLLILVIWKRCKRAPRTPRNTGLVGRRMGVILFALPTFIVAWPMIAGLAARSAEADHRNVLLVVLDTTRADRLSAYGYGRPTAPALDRLAAEGLTFTRAYAAAPWTLPSHASMFTGEYPSVHGATREHPYLDDRLPTLAERLSDMGLVTVAVSQKSWLREETGVMRGFDHFHDLLGLSNTAAVTLYRFCDLKLRGTRGVRDKGAGLVTERARQWLDRHDQRPFFMFINYTEPHAEYAPPSPFRERFLEARSDTPWGRQRFDEVAKYNAGYVEYGPQDLSDFSDLYDAEVNYQDSRLEELLGEFRRRGLLDKTLIIVTADHGENLGEHGLLGHMLSVADSLLHVPLVVRLPDRIPAGMRWDAPVENRLIWSLIEQVIGPERSEEVMDPRQLAAALQANDGLGSPILSELDREDFSTEFWQKSSRRARFDRRLSCLRVGSLKYVRGSDGSEELFDVASDPKELKNLAAERPDDLARMRALLLKKMESLDLHEAGAAPEFSPEMIEQLKAMGYIN